MSRKPNPEQWRPLNLDSEYAPGMAWTRLESLMNDDAFMLFFTEGIRNAICNAIFTSGDIRTAAGGLRSDNLEERIMYVLEETPMSMLLTKDFKWHIVSLVKTAITAGSLDKGEALG